MGLRELLFGRSKKLRDYSSSRDLSRSLEGMIGWKFGASRSIKANSGIVDTPAAVDGQAGTHFSFSRRFDSATPRSGAPQWPQGLDTPASVSSPLCRCGTRTLLLHVNHKSVKGNQGRPYYKCPKCGHFHSFADNRGIASQNPLCTCGMPSRLERAGERSGWMGYFTCASGRCDYWVKQEWQRVVPSLPEMQDTSLQGLR
jgi:hypothetical protein